MREWFVVIGRALDVPFSWQLWEKMSCGRIANLHYDHSISRIAFFASYITSTGDFKPYMSSSHVFEEFAPCTETKKKKKY